MDARAFDVLLRRQRFLCRDCGRHFNPLTGTPLSGMCDAKNWLPFAREWSSCGP